MKKILKKVKKCIIMSGMALLLFGAVAQPTQMTVYAATTQTQQQTLNQSPRWEGTGDTWKVRTQDNSGYLTNTWFEDLDGSWYMLGSDGLMYHGLVTDQATQKTYLLNTVHDGTFGKMHHVDGVYNVNGKDVYLTFNQQHDGTFGAITNGLSEVRSTGVNELKLSSIPMDTTKDTAPPAQQQQTQQQQPQQQTFNSTSLEQQAGESKDAYIDRLYDMYYNATNSKERMYIYNRISDAERGDWSKATTDMEGLDNLSKVFK